jgi:uncharacterized protein (TIGR00255 family)
MIHSMTGFGRGRAEDANFRVQVEIRAVNHRFLDIRFHFLFTAPELEAHLRKRIASRLHRGKVDLTIAVEEKEARTDCVRVDRTLIREYLETLKGLREEMSLVGEVSLDHVAALPWGRIFEVGVLELKDSDYPVFDAALDRALEQLLEMRGREGSALAEDLGARVTQAKKVAEEISSAADGVPDHYRERLTERMQQLLGEGEYDQGRILQEAAVMADRSDISEELTRLRAHLEQIGELLEGEEGSGKRLDFLLQECHREANTVGAKGRGLEIAPLVVEMKSLIEAMREQAQNVE